MKYRYRFSPLNALAFLGVCAGLAQSVNDAVAAQLNISITNQSGQSVGNVVAYANLLSGTAPVRAKREVFIEQLNKEFVPLVTVAQTGTLVNFPNRDPFRHHIYSFSPAKQFEIKLYSGVPAKPVAFDKPGEIVLGCNIHDTMVAYMLIVDTPFFGKSDAQGKLAIDGLVPGEYEVNLWYPPAMGGGGTGTQSLFPPQKIRVSAENIDLKLSYTPRTAVGKPGVAK